MENFPQLDIQQDLDNLNSDNEDTSVVISEDLSAPLDTNAPMDRIFIGKPTNGKKISRPTNKKKIIIPKEELPQEIEVSDLPEGFAGHVKKEKKPLSEKQKAHLTRIRKLAAEKKAAKKAAKDAALAKVNEEHKAKSTYKKRTKIIKDVIEETPDPIDKVDKDFQKRVVKEDIEQIKKNKWQEEENQFIRFMSNMEKYEQVKAGYMAQQKAESDKKKNIELQKKKQINKAAVSQTALKKPVKNIVPKILKPPSENPYDGMFQW